MVKTQTRKDGQQGFTLIEIIAVLVILGILAAVAIPKYNDLQYQSYIKTAKGALPSVVTMASNDYHAYVMSNDGKTGSDFTTSNSGSVGDFLGSYTALKGAVTAYVTSAAPAAGPLVWFSKIKADDLKTLTYAFTIP